MRSFTRLPRKAKKRAVILSGLRNRTRKPSAGIVLIRSKLEPGEQSRIARELTQAFERHRGRFMIVSNSHEQDVKFIPLPAVKKLHVLNR